MARLDRYRPGLWCLAILCGGPLLAGSACTPPTATPTAAAPGEAIGTPTREGAPSASAEQKAGPRPEAESAAAQAAAAPAAAAAPLKELPQLLSEEERGEGWISLFDGHTLFGWAATSQANWHVDQGALVVSQGDPGLLCTTSPFADYVLRLEFRAAAGTNSGIFLRTPRQPQDPGSDCYELNIAPPDNPFPTGSLVKRQKAAEVPERQDWQTYEVRVEGPSVRVTLNGDTVLEYEDPGSLRQGYIGLQLNQGEVAFRNLRLLPLGLQPLFNGQDLSGWKSYPEMASRFRVDDEGNLDVRGGRGQLESEMQFGNFVVQLDCLTHAPHLNSGLFYRCIPGEQMNGYEVQIHNGFRDGDRTKPVDGGTGGIFRRQNARIVAANDKEWFTMTVVADGAHVATWVQGLQVADWSDTRAPHENPRQGLRLEPGTFMLQGHDPTTHLSFRRLRAAPLSPESP